MTVPISLLPPLTGSVLPPPTPQGLSDDEQRLITGLSTKLNVQSVYVRLRYLYYDGEQAIRNIGISIPAVLAGVRQVVDWPRICVDRLVERASTIDGFRLPGATEVDPDLQAMWAANDLDAELPLLQQDSLAGGRGYMVIGSPDDGSDVPVATVESPLNLSLAWDARKRAVIAAYQSYEVDGVYKAALYLPDQTVSMSRDETSTWVVDDRDLHGFGEVPVVRFPNRSRSSDREGRSQITPAVMSTTDSACRALLGMEIAREVYSIPHLAILGAKESDFIDAVGNSKSALDMAMTKLLAFERDEEGQLPTLQQLKAFDPSVFTKIIDEHAQLMSSYTGFPPSYFGQTSTANPASADAIRVAENGIERGGTRVQQQSTAPLRHAGQLLWRFANRGQQLTDQLRSLSVDWVDTATRTPSATSDAVSKQVSVGSVPPRSDVTLQTLGYNALQRARLKQDADQAEQLEAELTSSMAARQARAANAIANDLAAAGDGTQQTDGGPASG